MKKSNSSRKKDDASSKSVNSDNSSKNLAGNDPTMTTEKSKNSASPGPQDTQIKFGSNQGQDSAEELPVKKVKLEESKSGRPFEINSKYSLGISSNFFMYLFDYQKKSNNNSNPSTDTEGQILPSSDSSSLQPDSSVSKQIETQKELISKLEGWEIQNVLSLRDFRDYFCN